MDRKQALQKACFLLQKQAKEQNLARFLLMYLVDENSSTFNSNLDKQLPKEIEEKYFDLIDDHLKNDTPLSHLVGFDYFYDRKFVVTKDVLSPRMETEELIYLVLEYVKREKLDDIKILDLCTGSGIIGITLQKELEHKINVEVSASDISDKALNIARKNAENLGANIKFYKSDLFNDIEKEKFNIIVSNPPYIAYSDKETIEDNVLNFDPHLALFADENGMYFYRKIIENAENYLTANGIIFFEIGYNQRQSIRKLAEQNSYSVEIYKDINGKDRMAKLYK